MLLALAIRWPYLWLVPRFTDETLEVQASLAILRDGARPLTNYDSYYGALYNYLVAGALALTGESPLAPRVVVLVAGILTVAATYGLGRALSLRLPGALWGGATLPAARCVGIVAATLLAVNGPHIVVNSHVAWSNCLTPLFTTAAFWVLLRRTSLTPTLSQWERGQASPLWCLRERGAGGVSTAPRGGSGVGPPAGRPAARACTPDSSSGGGAAARASRLACSGATGDCCAHPGRGWQSPVSRSGTPTCWRSTVSMGLNRSGRLSACALSTARTSRRAPATLGAAGSMLLLLARILGGAVDQRADWVAYLFDPGVLMVGALAIAGLIVAARRGEIVPLAASLSFLLILPAANPKFTTLITSRYLMPIVPLWFACAGWRWCWQCGPWRTVVPNGRRASRWLASAWQRWYWRCRCSVSGAITTAR